MIECEQTTNSEIAWFWAKRWQRMEQNAQAEIDAGQVHSYANPEDAISALKDLESDAKN